MTVYEKKEEVKEEIKISLSKDVALVLFDCACRVEDLKKDQTIMLDGGERGALIRLQGKLESILVEPFMKNYDELLRKAKKNLEFHEDPEDEGKRYKL